MTLAQLRELTRLYVPGAKTNTISNPQVDLILNNGVKDIAVYTLCLKANKKFNVVADQSQYNLSSVIGDYVGVDKSGLWWNAGSATSTNWQQLNPRTLKALDNERINWRDLGSDDPQDYTIDGDILTIVPAGDTALANGLWLYYGKKPTIMSADGHYSFSGSTTEYTHLSIFDEAIIGFAKWKLQQALNKDGTDDYKRLENSYKTLREEAFKLFKRRLDISHSEDLRMQGLRP